MIKKFTGLLAGECSRFLARRLGFPSRLLPRASTRQEESTPGITILPATQAEKFTCLVIFIQLQITCCGLEQQSSDTIIGLFIYVVIQFYNLGFNFISLCFKIIIIHYHTQRQRKIIFKPRIKQASSEFQKPSLSK